MKCRAEAMVTSPAMVYIVLLYRNGLKNSFNLCIEITFLPWIYGSLRHDAHKFRNCQSLGLYQGTRVGNIHTELSHKHVRVNLGQQI